MEVDTPLYITHCTMQTYHGKRDVQKKGILTVTTNQHLSFEYTEKHFLSKKEARANWCWDTLYDIRVDGEGIALCSGCDEKEYRKATFSHFHSEADPRGSLLLPDDINKHKLTCAEKIVEVISAQLFGNRESPLSLLLSTLDYQRIKSVMDEHPILITKPDTQSPLYICVYNCGSLDIVNIFKLILSYYSHPDAAVLFPPGFNINSTVNGTCAPMLHSILRMDPKPEIIGAMLAAPGLDVRVRSPIDDTTALHVFIEHCNTLCYRDFMQDMINKGIDVNATNKLGETPLHMTTRNTKVCPISKFLPIINSRNSVVLFSLSSFSREGSVADGTLPVHCRC
jgi:hypothetical protein